MNKKSTCLFQPISIGNVEIKNRIGMAPMSVFGMVSADGCFTQRGIDYYVERAKGGAGLIITGYSEIENEVEVSLSGIVQNPSVNPPRFICTAGEMTERVHTYGAKIFLQITLGLGRVGYEPWISCKPIAPSAIPNFWNPQETCREISLEEIQFLIKKSGEAAKIAKLAGFDGVEIHAVHEGYLLDQFALAMFNKRGDKYGGDLRGRLALSTEIVQQIKGVVGQEFPVIMRFSVKSFIKDWNKGGLPGETFIEKGRDVDEGLEAAKILQEAGYDALDADCGTYEGFYWAHPPGYQKHGCYLPFVERLKEVVKIPILMAGRMEIPALAEKALSEGKIDMVLLGRGLLAEPFWPVKVRSNQIEKIRPCLGCHDGCLGRQDLCRPLSCAVNPACGREVEYALHPPLQQKKVLIIGGGVAGLEAARVSALRGHQVSMYEKTNQLGGHLTEASVPDFKEDERRLIDWYKNELDELGIPIYLGEEVSAELIEAKKPEVIIVATGSTSRIPQIQGVDQDHVLTACEALLDQEKVGDPVVVIGGGLVGCEVALWLRRQNKNVTIVEITEELMWAGDVPYANKQMLHDLLEWHNVKIMTGTTVAEISLNRVEIIDRSFQKDEIPAATVILATGYQPDRQLYEKIKDLIPETYLIGDARKVRNIMWAIWDAYEIARSI
ncbi:FAD-dependent oxidoreductase [Candidatus Formimonas warabiya]|uniref:2-enoate reductase n=1 Tax=Formimonas warabiya TaxID=1761012 RepID=A0A3G1KUH6_FORW1|nr:FAD-dependent oxidoreductase [Candidatus Formimonas warabiya]ATW26128.1 2-enoate reductase [Candidatus Formimonas warabiya]